MHTIKINFRLAILVLSLILASCSSKEDKPLDRDEFKAVLKDIHLADGVVNAKNLTSQIKTDEEVNIYSYVLKKHRISRLDLEKTIEYYADHTEEYHEIYVEIVTELRALNDSIHIPVGPQTTVVIDSTNLWKRKDRWALPEDGRINTITFKLRKPEHGEYTLSADIKLYPDDGSVAQRMTILVKYDDDSQEENSAGNLKKNGKFESHEVFIQTDTSRVISEITCWVLNHSQGTKQKHASVKNIRLERKDIE